MIDLPNSFCNNNQRDLAVASSGDAQIFQRSGQTSVSDFFLPEVLVVGSHACFECPPIGLSLLLLEEGHFACLKATVEKPYKNYSYIVNVSDRKR